MVFTAIMICVVVGLAAGLMTSEVESENEVQMIKDHPQSVSPTRQASRPEQDQFLQIA